MTRNFSSDDWKCFPWIPVKNCKHGTGLLLQGGRQLKLEKGKENELEGLFTVFNQTKMHQTNWTQVLNRKSTNTPVLRLIFACTLTLKRVFNEFLEAQLRSSKGVYLYSFYWTFGSNLSASCCQIKGNMISKAIF